MNTQSQAQSIWASILTAVASPSGMTCTLLQSSKALSYKDLLLTVEISEEAMELLNNPKMIGHLERVAGAIGGLDGTKIVFKSPVIASQSPPTTSSPTPALEIISASLQSH